MVTTDYVNDAHAAIATPEVHMDPKWSDGYPDPLPISSNKRKRSSSPTIYDDDASSQNNETNIRKAKGPRKLLTGIRLPELYYPSSLYRNYDEPLVPYSEEAILDSALVSLDAVIFARKSQPIHILGG